VLILDMIEVLPPLGKYKYDTWRIPPVKCYIGNSVHLQSCIRNINSHKDGKHQFPPHQGVWRKYQPIISLYQCISSQYLPFQHGLSRNGVSFQGVSFICGRLGLLHRILLQKLITSSERTKQWKGHHLATSS
jgi:hypothetical protein